MDEGGVEKHHFVELYSLTAESIQSPALPLQRIDDIHGSHSLAAGMFSVCDRITDDILQKHLENPTGLLIDQACHI